MTIVKKSIPLSEDGSFEKIVNAGTQRHRTEKVFWTNKVFKAIVVLFSIWLVSLVLCATGTIGKLAAVMISEAITCAVSFLAGRLWEKAFK